MKFDGLRQSQDGECQSRTLLHLIDFPPLCIFKRGIPDGECQSRSQSRIQGPISPLGLVF